MKLFRKIVDERQELEMLRVERVGFWVLFLGLAAAVVVQVFAVDFKPVNIAGELIVFMIGGIISTIGYVRRGAWSYFSKPGMKSYIIASAVAAFIFGLVMPLERFFRLGTPLSEKLTFYAIFFAISFAVMFIVTFLLMWLLGSITKKRQTKLQQEFEEEAQ